MRRFEFENVTTGLRFPEGPVAMKDGSILLVEIEKGTLTHVAQDGSTQTIAKLGGGPNGVAVGPDGAAYICNNGGLAWNESAEFGLRPVGSALDGSGGRIERVDLSTRKVRVLYTASDQAPLNGPNDLVFDDQGGFYFTDFGKMRPRDLDRGAVCYAAADGSFIREILHPFFGANGIGLSPDRKTLYVAETVTCRLWAFDIQGPGEIRKHPWPQSPNGGRLVRGLDGFRGFDSLAVDAEGNICLATLHSGTISVISPEGVLVDEVPTPDPMVTNICFGGPDMRTAYCTMSTSGRLMKAQWPRSGLKLRYEV